MQVQAVVEATFYAKDTKNYFGNLLNLVVIIFIITFAAEIATNMKIKSQYKVREMAGENVVIMQGKGASDLTRIISLNESALYLWGEVEGKEFDTKMVAELLAGQYGIDMDIAERDAQRWIDRLDECGLIE